MDNNNINKKNISRRRNFLTKVLRVQTIYTRENEQGKSSGYIYKEYIEHQFNISRSTFYEYLTIPAKKELKNLQK